MSVYYPSCGSVPDPTCSDCPPKELGRTRSIFYQRVDFEFTDPTNPIEWDAAIQARNVYIFPYAKGALSPSPNLQDGYGNVDQDYMSTSYSLDSMLSTNLDAQTIGFFNSVKRNNNYRVGWVTETLVWRSSVGATIIPTLPVADDLKSRVTFKVDHKFVQEDIPVPTMKPAGIFDRCILPS